MKFNIIIIGGGHAGIEAANICAQRNVSVLLITSHVDLIGQMSCNPAIGGIAKGNIVREVDALGGLMGKIIDNSGIHFKMLNKTKGMAVWGNRAQADKQQYRKVAKRYLEQHKTLSILQGLVEALNVEAGKVKSVLLNNGEIIEGEAIILCMGTFLNGIGHIGLNSFPCGRLGEPSSLKLTESIVDLGIKAGRLKTGTSPRIDGRTVDFSKLIPQEGDKNPWAFSFSTERILENKAVCWITKSNKKTHEIIRENLNRSPLYTGKIKSNGPRYCPSIEDKIVRFGERDGHTLFLEPEGLDTHEMYLNGLSTSLPFDTQIKMVQSLNGLENARIIRPGYGIEYDYFTPLQLKPTLESKTVKNLFFAGQINGTSGYEEAACQGLVAGINAVENIRDKNNLILGRDTSYIGVLIDDLITKGTEEPYRMFTSRAEFRLELRQDNCDERLMPIAFERELVESDIYLKRQRIWDKKKKLMESLHATSVAPQKWNEKNPDNKITQAIKLFDLLRRPEISIEQTEEFLEEKCDISEVWKGTEADIKYSGFVEKEKIEYEKYRKFENAQIPEDLDFNKIFGLLNETKSKFAMVKPKSFGQASRIPGVTPADISVLMVYVSKNKHVSRGTVDL
jgi:tRNA uridine 5-carboxymethylaminomethyl modification enzyme